MLHPNPERARLIAERLLPAYRTRGIFGKRDMPEDLLPAGVTAGSEEHLRFITLTVAIDYQRDADQLWHAARETYADPALRYLFDPGAVDRTPRSQLIRDMAKYKLSKKPENDPNTWQTLCTTLVIHFGEMVGNLIARADHDALQLLSLIRSRERKHGFPFLKGPKIGPLWIRMLHDNCHVELKNLHHVPLPIDVHTAQASLQLGAVTAEPWRGRMEHLRKAAQAAWEEALAQTAAAGEYPLRLDEPLWLLSRNGCRRTQTWPCEFSADCPVADLCDPRHPRVSIQGAETRDDSDCRISLGDRQIKED